MKGVITLSIEEFIEIQEKKREITIKEKELFKEKEVVLYNLDQYIEHLQEKRLGKQTISRYRNVLLRYLQYIGFDLANATIASITNFKKSTYTTTVIKGFFKFVGIQPSMKKGKTNPMIESFKSADLYDLQISQSTLNTYAHKMVNLMNLINNNIDFLTKEILEDWLKGKSSSTKMTMISALEKFIQYFDIELDIDLNRFKPSKRDIANIQEKNIQESYLTDNELEVVIKWLKNEPNKYDDLKEYYEYLKNKCIILLGLDCGFRIQSVPKIKIEDIDFERSTISTLDKGNKYRNVKITNKMKSFLKRYIKEFKLQKDDWLINNKGKRYTDTGAINKRCSNLLEELGLKTKERDLSFHNLRHTYSTLLYNSGVPLEAIQKQVGHTKIENTQIYAKANDKTLNKLLGRSRIL